MSPVWRFKGPIRPATVQLRLRGTKVLPEVLQLPAHFIEAKFRQKFIRLSVPPKSVVKFVESTSTISPVHCSSPAVRHAPVTCCLFSLRLIMLHHGRRVSVIRRNVMKSVIGLLFAAAIFATVPISAQVTPRGLELSVDGAKAITYGHARRVQRRVGRREFRRERRAVRRGY